MTQLLHYFFRSHLQVLSVLVLLLSQRLSAQVLIAGTEFDPLPGYEDSTYFDLNGVKQYGLQTGALSINRPFATSANANIFHGTPQYAISNNPANLDNVRYMDTPASTDYQLILSPGTTTPSNVLHYKVFGLKPGSKVTVDVSYCNIMSTTNATCNEQYGIKGIINPDAANINNGSNSPQVAEGACGTFTFTMQGTEVIGANGEANFYLNLDKAGTCTPLGIKKVEVFGTPNPQIISAQGLEVCAGEQITIQPKQYYDANYQWFLNGNPISGATNPTLLHSVLTTGDYEFTLRITPKTSGATSVTSEKLTVKAITCCGEEGKPASRTTIFQDNFGRLDMTDKTGGHYYAWDYTTDRLNPKEVRKATDNPFRWKLDPAPLNATYKATGAPEDGQYVVAAVLGSGDVSGVTGGYVGAQLSWANKILGPTNIPNPDIATDHSEKIDGGVLLLNVPQNSVDKSLYTREFTGLCDKQLYFEAWIAVFTNSPADASAPYNPVKIKVRLTDMLSNASEESAVFTATRQKDGGGQWVRVSGSIKLSTGSNQMRMEIINTQNVSIDGNDLALDDIKIMACAPPSLDLFYDLTTLARAKSVCNESVLQMVVKPSQMLIDYFNGTPSYKIQWTTDSTFKSSSWKDLLPLQSGTTFNLNDPKSSIAFQELVAKTKNKVYFRVIAGEPAELNSVTEYSISDPCRRYSISTPIEANIVCPLNIKLVSFTGTKTNSGNLIQWTTASEQNNHYFLVERSINGVHFEPIYKEFGAGNSNLLKSYSFEDLTPFEGINYYRLKQVDKDGISTYSKIITIHNQAADFAIYPNPNQGTFSVKISSKESFYTLDIVDIQGRVVYQKSGESTGSAVEVSGLEEGIYFVKLYINGETFVQKLVVY